MVMQALLVVIYQWEENVFLSFHSLSVLYMVPLFFVISGFMLPKNIILGAFSCSLRFIYRKMKFLLFTTFFFYLFTHL